MAGAAQFLKEVSIFRDFSDNELGCLEKIVSEQTFQRNDAIFIEGAPGDSLFIVHSGTVKIMKKVTNDKEKTLLLLRPKDIFGEMALLDGGPRSASAIALETTEQYVINAKSFGELVSQNAATAIKVLKRVSNILSARIRKTTDNVKDLVIWGIGLDKTKEETQVEHILIQNMELKVVLTSERELIGKFKGIQEGSSTRDIILRDASGNEFLIPSTAILYIFKKEERVKTGKYI